MLSLIKRVKRFLVAIPLLGGLTILLLGYSGASAHREGIEKNSFALALGFFLMPLIVQVIALFFLWIRKVNRPYYFFNLFVTMSCLGFCAYFWARYFEELKGPVFQSLSRESLYVILGVVLCVGVMTYAIMRPSTDHFGGAFCTHLNDGIRDHPFWGVVFFFTLFLNVAYLFGFALAFHNKYSLETHNPETIVRRDSSEKGLEQIAPPEVRPALRMENYKSIDDWTASRTVSQSNNATGQSQEHKTNQFSFYFKSGEGHLQTEEMGDCNVNSPPTHSFNVNLSPTINNERFNDCQLTSMAKRIEEGTNNGNAVRVILIGHSDNEPVGRADVKKNKGAPVLRYVSNYELSSARADDVRYQILQRISDKRRWHNIEWVILPASNEEIDEIPVRLINQNPTELLRNFSADQIARGVRKDELYNKLGKDVFAKVYESLGQDRSAQEKRVVLASVQSLTDHVANLTVNQISRSNDARPLTLVDYMYFSIYTITTTGYGDITPTTAYAKFVTSIANFCEVLFLVVFFNALISLRPKPTPSVEVEQPAQQRDPPGDDGVPHNQDVRAPVVHGAFGRE